MSTTLTTTAPAAPVCPECKGGEIRVLYSYAAAELVAVTADGWPTVGPTYDHEVAGYECANCQHAARNASAFYPELPFCLACETEHEDPAPTAEGYVSCDGCDAAATVVTDTLHLCDRCHEDREA